ncbi:transglutaminase domain-containing protein [Seminavis robusta]|uniref:Transglutaminase domain-containing protein n=1 Tax=Seminavis robusta TaxID=568900 RepID=A0A9N8DRV8_9STRA|nr:transglutaminase domain-containing protein [Seminavis robusta]|eukprot:Sro209_g087310.1 transglutaminase domain-containing protein (243) ;mRNA; f:29557-30285
MLQLALAMSRRVVIALSLGIVSLSPALAMTVSPPPTLIAADPSLYLKPSQWIDFEHPEIQAKAAELAVKASDNHGIIRSCFEFVRDEIMHSSDYQQDPVTCKASNVLQHKTGYCYAKSHLLASLLRANGIPTGLCYQRLTIADDDSGPPYCLHGLNAVYLPETKEWFRVDPRGLKPTIQQAVFDPPHEVLAFPIRTDIGEADFPRVYIDPLPLIVETLTTRTKSWKDVLDHLPDAEALEEAG